MTDSELERLDVAVARRGMARSREHATRLITAGRVTVEGHTVRKTAARIAPTDVVAIAGDATDADYVSRGGEKLAGALAAFGARGPAVRLRACLDLGASTGGFTDVLLRHGAERVACVDVGHDQLAGSVRDDPRVAVFEGTDARRLTREQLGGPPELIVADLSFISLTHVLPVVDRLGAPTADVVLLVKPQFEVGRGQVGKRGVVRDPAMRAQAVRAVCRAADRLGWGLQALTPSPVAGTGGNIEYFAWLRRGPAAVSDDAVDQAVATVPAGEKVSS